MNKIATLRNSRGKNLPNVASVAADILRFGAHGITVHPRPDARHIRFTDVAELSELVKTWNQEHSATPEPVEFNVEGYPDTDFLDLIFRIKPHQCTLVPDPPDALTSNAGWKVAKQADFLAPILQKLRAQSIRSSLFLDPLTWTDEDSRALLNLKPDRIELYTETFSDCFGTKKAPAVNERYQTVAAAAKAGGIGINAGHDLNLKNLASLIQLIPETDEVSIGHALVCESLYMGLEKTVDSYLRVLGWR